MSETQARSGRRPVAKALKIFGASALLLVLVGGGYWAWTCPCEGVPGFVLRGELHDEPVTDWSFANEVDLCQIQIGVAWRPHSVNLNCMATPSGELFLSCSVGANKYWCPRVGPDHSGRLRLDGVVYPVVLSRVEDPSSMDAAWQARVRKLQRPDVQARQPPGSSPPPLDAERPGHWWTFRVESPPAG
jgi:hypothetical protein